MSKLRRLSGLILLIGLSSTVPAHADVVGDWNELTMMYVNVGNPAAVPPIPIVRAGPPGFFDIAIVQAAVHDAVQAIEGRFEPYYYSDLRSAGSAHRRRLLPRPPIVSSSCCTRDGRQPLMLFTTPT